MLREAIGSVTLSTRSSHLTNIRRMIRDSIQRTQCWWLPYLVMEYEVNQILITPLGGDLEKPLYMYQAHLCVPHYIAI
jgi:serum/glucocorticoid-regulated kinase 2